MLSRRSAEQFITASKLSKNLLRATAFPESATVANFGFTEELFNKIPLGKLVSCSIDGRELFGTVIEKIKPTPAQVDEVQEPVELPEIPTTENAPASLIGETPNETPTTEENSPPVENPAPVENPQPEEISQPAQIDSPDEKIRAVINSFKENPQVVEAETEIINSPAQSEEKIRAIINSFKENPQAKPNDKFIIKISLPVERDFECRPNARVTVKIKI